MKKSVKIVSALALVAGMGLASSAMAQAPAVPYLYVYVNNGANLVKGVSVTGYSAGNGSTAQIQGGKTPVTVAQGADKNVGLVTAYAGTSKAPKASGPVSVNVTYNILPAGGGGPIDCTVGLSTTNIADNTPIVVTPPSGLCGMFFHPVPGTITSSAKPITINWEIQNN